MLLGSEIKEGELVWGLILHYFLCPPKFTFSLKTTGGRQKNIKLFGTFENVGSDYTFLISVEIYVDYNIVSAHLGQYMYHVVITIYFLTEISSNIFNYTSWSL